MVSIDRFIGHLKQVSILEGSHWADNRDRVVLTAFDNRDAHKYDLVSC